MPIFFLKPNIKRNSQIGFHFLGKKGIGRRTFLYGHFHCVYDVRNNTGCGCIRLITMCLVHDFPEARTGDLNYVQKKYVTADENQAVKDAIEDLPFGPSLADLIGDFKEGESLEARLARDADQLALCLELKSLMDMGFKPSGKWLSSVSNRLRTEAGKKLYESIMKTNRDAWWLKNYVDELNKIC